MSALQHHGKYIHRYIVNPFRVIILHYAENIHDMHNAAI